jgi:hypothetical protein
MWEEGQPSVVRKRKKNTKQKWQSNRAKFASLDKVLLDRFTMPRPPPQCPHPPRGKKQNESEAILFLKALQTHIEHMSRAVRRVVLCWALALSPDCSLQSILESAALVPSGQGYNIQTKEGKSMVPTIKSDIDFTITVQIAQIDNFISP